VLGGIVALALAHGLTYGLCVQDDTFISLRYAANLVAGDGLVYNAGERVEGYTNFLWTLYLGVAIALGANPVLSAVLGGLVCAAALVWLCGRPIDPDAPSWLAPLIVALLPGFLLEAVQGLETAFFAVLVAGGVWAAMAEFKEERRFAASSVWFALAALTRPEGVLLYGWIQLFGLVSKRRLPSRETVLGWAIFASVVGGHEVFRLLYYGLPLPNTFYAKTGGGIAQWGRGLVYVGAFARLHPVLSLLSVIGLVLLARRSAATRLVASLPVLYVLYVISVGGDFKPTFRFFWPVLGPLVLAIQATVDAGWRRRWGRVLVVIAGLLGAVVDLGGTWVRMHREATFRASVMENLLTVGNFLRDHVPPDTVLAIHSAGTVPFASGLRTIDLWGLTDTHTAHREVEGMGSGMAGHEKTDYEWSFQQNPGLYLPEEDLLTAEPVRQPVPMDFPAGFESRYEAFSIRVGDRWLNLFRRIADPVTFR